MATLVLAAAGSALGGAVGGGVAGVAAAALGRAAGAAAGNLIDQTLLGSGAAPVETGRVDRFRVMGAREGAPMPRVVGSTRVAGQVIWASRFLDTVVESDAGGKGAPRRRRGRTATASASRWRFARGRSTGSGASGSTGASCPPTAPSWRLHRGDEDAAPDPLIAALEGEAAPAYRGLAYLVFEDLDLTDYGNRVPQVHAEVFRSRASTRPSRRRSRRRCATSCAAWRSRRARASSRSPPSRCAAVSGPASSSPRTSTRRRTAPTCSARSTSSRTPRPAAARCR
jgi:hypothetical protein